MAIAFVFCWIDIIFIIVLFLMEKQPIITVHIFTECFVL